MNKKYFAHSTADSSFSNWQLLSDHLNRTGKLAEASGSLFRCGPLARSLGLLHDLGKYTDAFQRRLEGHPARVDHSTAGAVEAVERYGQNLGTLLAYAI